MGPGEMAVPAIIATSYLFRHSDASHIVPYTVLPFSFPANVLNCSRKLRSLRWITPGTVMLVDTEGPIGRELRTVEDEQFEGKSEDFGLERYAMNWVQKARRRKEVRKAVRFLPIRETSRFIVVSGEDRRVRHHK
jgi:hypothetical protein